MASRRDFRTRNAAARFWICDFSSCMLTTMPVGMCVMRTAEYVVFTDCPPGPELMKMSIFRSFGSISISSSSSSASGNTITPAAEVWMRPCDSVTGMRCTRCTPPSYFRLAHTPSSGAGVPLARMAICTSLTPPSSVVFSDCHGDGPAALLGVSQIHAQQVAGEQRCLLAARTGLDLHDDVPGVIGGRAGSARSAASPRPPAARLRAAWPHRRIRSPPPAISRAASRSSRTAVYD